MQNTPEQAIVHHDRQIEDILSAQPSLRSHLLHELWRTTSQDSHPALLAALIGRLLLEHERAASTPRKV